MGFPDRITAEAPRLEWTACPACGSQVVGARDFAFPPYRVVSCGECTLWYTTPRIHESDLARLYSDGYFESSGSHGYASYRRQESALRATYKRLIRRLLRRELIPSGGAILDVGCAMGFLLAEAREHFGHVAGVDFSAEALDEARKVADEVFLGDINQVPEANRYDVVVATQVIEHVYHPVPWIQQLTSRLRPGGALVLTTPNFGGFWRKCLGRQWPSFKLPEHVAFFTADTLRTTMTSAGAISVATLDARDCFPSADVFAKIGLPSLGPLGEINITIPRVSVCAVGYRPKSRTR